MTSDIDALWCELEALERRLRAPVPHDAHHGADWFDDWRARLDRVKRVRSALFFSGPMAHWLVAERLCTPLRCVQPGCPRSVEDSEHGQVLAGLLGRRGQACPGLRSIA